VSPIGLKQSKTIDVDLFAKGATTDPWNVEATTNLPGGLSFAWGKHSGRSGETLPLKVSVTRAAPMNAYAVRLTSRLGAQTSTTFFTVGTPP
jgi:hypothetical protein